MEWTKIENGLPEMDDDGNSIEVLITVDYKGHRVVFPAYLADYKWYWLEDNKEISEEVTVIAWKHYGEPFKD